MLGKRTRPPPHEVEYVGLCVGSVRVDPKASYLHRADVAAYKKASRIRLTQNIPTLKCSAASEPSQRRRPKSPTCLTLRCQRSRSVHRYQQRFPSLCESLWPTSTRPVLAHTNNRRNDARRPELPPPALVVDSPKTSLKSWVNYRPLKFIMLNA
ncbi:hypothetical protein BC830DRAFT_403499 [Chytriomyces sp. MP71]|nr:hypothetical protein BC830DRAFT_403499 [Chytriomyces sp. MP71]